MVGTCPGLALGSPLWAALGIPGTVFMSFFSRCEAGMNGQGLFHSNPTMADTHTGTHVDT